MPFKPPEKVRMSTLKTGDVIRTIETEAQFFHASVLENNTEKRYLRLARPYTHLVLEDIPHLTHATVGLELWTCPYRDDYECYLIFT